MKKDIIYLRTSTEEQHPENQLADCLSIAPKGAEVYEEKGSAWKENKRPLFKQIYQSIIYDKIKSITVWDLDRIYRNRLRTVEFMRTCKKHNVSVRSYRQQFLNALSDAPYPWNDIFKDLLIQLLAWLAEDESNKKSERIRAAYRRNKTNWGRPKVKVNKFKIYQMKKSGQTLKQIAESEGISMMSVSRILRSMKNIEKT